MENCRILRAVRSSRPPGRGTTAYGCVIFGKQTWVISRKRRRQQACGNERQDEGSRSCGRQVAGRLHQGGNLAKARRRAAATRRASPAPTRKDQIGFGNLPAQL